MKIGYCVEGSTDRAFLEGLRQRWCPQAEMMPGRFRGSFGRREIPHACIELEHKGVDLIVLLRDANNENWRDVLREDRKRCAAQHQHMTVFGVCDRNIECWLTADRHYVARQTGLPPEAFQVDDPKTIFEDVLGIAPLDRQEPRIVRFTREAPLENWLTNSSFEDFYDNLRQKSIDMQCNIENLRDRQR